MPRASGPDTRRQVQTEYAQSRLTRQPVYIGDAERGLARRAYVCPNPDCGWPMQAVKGKVRRHHFRHLAGGPLDAAACNESRLHYDAKHILARVINDGGIITVDYPCGCGQRHGKPFGPGLRAEVERKADWIGMERWPDVTVMDADKTLAYFELVVNHPPDYDIADDRIDAPVMTIPVAGQEDLDALDGGRVRVDSYGIGPCDTPPNPEVPDTLLRQWRKERDLPYKREAWRDLGPMRNPLPPTVPLVRWQVDSFQRDGQVVERYLRRDTRLDLHRRAQVLLDHGFAQSHAKPALFYYRTPKVTLYASLRSTDVLNIWEAPEPMLFVFPRQRQTQSFELGLYATALVQYASHLLDKTCAGSRVSFYHDSLLADLEGPLLPWWGGCEDDDPWRARGRHDAGHCGWVR